jgi:CDGSH-type Zn-finger protein
MMLQQITLVIEFLSGSLKSNIIRCGYSSNKNYIKHMYGV